jgi:hypothetical protein
MMKQIEKHGANLNAIFNTGLDNVKLCKKLLRLERQAHHAATCLCNTNTLDRLELNWPADKDIHQATEEEQDAFFEKILIKVNKILNFKTQGIPVFINHDPRGYALKIKSEYVKKTNMKIHQDWGGFGIIAPDFTEN